MNARLLPPPDGPLLFWAGAIDNLLLVALGGLLLLACVR